MICIMVIYTTQPRLSLPHGTRSNMVCKQELSLSAYVGYCSTLMEHVFCRARALQRAESEAYK